MKNLLIAACLCLAPLASADVWDVQSQHDNTFDMTENELVHGSDQLHDLGVLGTGGADSDWFRLLQAPYSSYEVVVDATSGDIGAPDTAPKLVLERRSTSTNVVQPSAAVGINLSRTLRFQNSSATPNSTERIYVASGSCTTNCGADDVYRIRAYETTYAIARFNNVSPQVTVLVLQNPTPASVDATVFFWSSTGSLLYTYVVPTLAPKTVLAVSTASLGPPPPATPPLAGQNGAITIAHNAGYGRLSGKAVSMDPVAGYSFDSPMVAIPH